MVHAHFIGLWGYVGVALKGELHVPLVVTAHGGDAYSIPLMTGPRREIAEQVVRSADRLIAVSKPIAENLADLGASREKIRVLPNGYDGSVFFPASSRESRALLGLPAEKKILLVVANLVPQKGHEYLLRCLQMMDDRGDLVLVVVGGGPLEPVLKRLTLELGLGSRVMFVGPKPHSEIPLWINACDLFVLPSVNEGSPTVIAEAMACGKPVVATKVGGIPDIVVVGRTGYLATAGDADELSAVIKIALSVSWDPGEILDAARGYSWAALAPKLVEIYREVAPI